MLELSCYILAASSPCPTGCVALYLQSSAHTEIFACIAAEVFGCQRQHDHEYLTKRVGQPGAGQDAALAHALLNQVPATVQACNFSCVSQAVFLITE